MLIQYTRSNPVIYNLHAAKQKKAYYLGIQYRMSQSIYLISQSSIYLSIWGNFRASNRLRTMAIYFDHAAKPRGIWR